MPNSPFYNTDIKPYKLFTNVLPVNCCGTFQRYRAKIFRWYIHAWFINLWFQGTIEKIHVQL